MKHLSDAGELTANKVSAIRIFSKPFVLGAAIRTLALIIVLGFANEIGHAQSSAKPDKIRVLLLTGKGAMEPYDPYYRWIHGFFPKVIVEALGETQVEVSYDTSLLTAAYLKNIDVVINDSLFMQPTTEQLEALLQYVHDGGGFLALHAGLLSSMKDHRYEEMLGARFIGHVPIKVFQVDTHDEWYGWGQAGAPRHPINANLPAFGITDELYTEQMLTSDLTVVARAEYHPIMWVRNYGTGRVVCLTLGHDELALHTRGFQELLSNGVEWAAKRL